MTYIRLLPFIAFVRLILGVPRSSFFSITYSLTIMIPHNPFFIPAQVFAIKAIDIRFRDDSDRLTAIKVDGPVFIFGVNVCNSLPVLVE